MRDTTTGCEFCNYTGQTDKTTDEGEWIKVTCSCVEPKSDEYWANEVAEIKEAIAAARNTTPAWMVV